MHFMRIANFNSPLNAPPIRSYSLKESSSLSIWGNIATFMSNSGHFIKRCNKPNARLRLLGWHVLKSWRTASKPLPRSIPLSIIKGLPFSKLAKSPYRKVPLRCCSAVSVDILIAVSRFWRKMSKCAKYSVSTASRYCSTLHHQSRKELSSASLSFGSKIPGFGSILYQSFLWDSGLFTAALAAAAAASAACTIRSAKAAPSMPCWLPAGLPSACCSMPALGLAKPWENYFVVCQTAKISRRDKNQLWNFTNGKHRDPNPEKGFYATHHGPSDFADQGSATILTFSWNPKALTSHDPFMSLHEHSWSSFLLANRAQVVNIYPHILQSIVDDLTPERFSLSFFLGCQLLPGYVSQTMKRINQTNSKKSKTSADECVRDERSIPVRVINGAQKRESAQRSH